MRTVEWPISRRSLDEVLATLREGALVVYPTETLYGIGLVLSAGDAGVARVRAAKRAPHDRPYLVLVASTEAAFALWSRVPPAAEALARAAWPGPLTLVGPAREGLPAGLLGAAPSGEEGGPEIPTISVRVPGDDPLRQLLGRLAEPLISTSANLAGAPAPASWTEVDLASLQPDLLLRTDRRLFGEPSTLLSVAEDPPRILRAGAWRPPVARSPSAP